MLANLNLSSLAPVYVMSSDHPLASALAIRPGVIVWGERGITPFNDTFELLRE